MPKTQKITRKKVGMITDATFNEISIVDKPANSLATIHHVELAKRAERDPLVDRIIDRAVAKVLAKVGLHEVDVADQQDRVPHRFPAGSRTSSDSADGPSVPVIGSHDLDGYADQLKALLAIHVTEYEARRELFTKVAKEQVYSRPQLIGRDAQGRIYQ